MAKSTSTSDYVMADVKNKVSAICSSPFGTGVRPLMPCRTSRTDLVSRATCETIASLAEHNIVDIQHQLWYLSLNGNLHKSVIPKVSGEINILDVGTGTGVWAVTMAKRWPNAKVIATDLTLPPQSDDTPSNLSFIQHNANDPEWPLEKFHFVHARMVDAGVHDWPAFRATCFRHLAPGGCLELGHVTQPRSEIPEFDDPSASPFLHLMKTIMLASKKGGLDYDVSTKHLQGLQETGFEEVEETTLLWPQGSWSQNEKDRETGALGLENTLRMLDTAAKYILTRENFMGDKEADDLIKAGREDLLQTDRKHFYIPMYVFRLFLFFSHFQFDLDPWKSTST